MLQFLLTLTDESNHGKVEHIQYISRIYDEVCGDQASDGGQNECYL